jgi:hypothetical protein
MKLSEQRDEVLIGGAQSVDAFTIKASAKAFSILSSNLYSNPLGSMIRELSTNAYDAHVMVGKKAEPFIITLPNSMDPSFKIRDFGPGLSNQEIHSVYTTFFESTKTDSNDVVGCLGLGSKSPFGVADSFTITSFHGGKRTVYSSFLNDARIPSIAKFVEEDTDEENGIEIEVAIKEENFYQFSKEVNKQLKYFTVKPEVRGNSDFEWHVNEEYLYTGNGWKMVAEGREPRVIQGQIQYPINTEDMGNAYSNASDGVRAILDRSILFEVAIGDVNIAPSREALSYDDATCENIIKAAQKILDELPAQVRESIEGCDSEYEARLKYDAIMTNLNRGHYHDNSISRQIAKSGEIMWNDKDVSTRDFSLAQADITSAVKFTRNYNGRFQKTKVSAYKPWNSEEDANWDFTAMPLNNIFWVYSTEDDKAVEGRSKQYGNVNFSDTFSLIIIKTTLTVSQLADRMGLKVTDLVIAADLPKVKRAPRSSTTKKQGPKEFTVQLFNKRAWKRTDQWESVVEENDLLGLEGYYVHLDRFEVSGKDGRRRGSLKEFISGAVELGILSTDDKVYGLRKMNQKRNHNLEELFEHVKTAVKSAKVPQRYVWHNNSRVIERLERFVVTDLKIVANTVRADSPMKPIIDAIIFNNLNHYSGHALSILEEAGQASNTVDITTESEKVDEIYPMVSQGGYYMDLTLLLNYVVQIDTLIELNGGVLPTA